MTFYSLRDVRNREDCACFWKGELWIEIGGASNGRYRPSFINVAERYDALLLFNVYVHFVINITQGRQ